MAEVIDIPFCVAGGIKSWMTQPKFFPLARIKFPSTLLAGGPDVNYSPGGSIWRAVYLVGIDTWYDGETGKYHVNQYPATKAAPASLSGKRSTGYRNAKTRCRRNRPQHDESGRRAYGYDLEQLKKVREVCHVPLIPPVARGPWNTSSKPSVMPTLRRAGSFRIPQTNNQYW